MSKLHIKKGDTVKVIAGNSKGQEGKVIEVMTSKYRALIEGVNMVSKHTKPNAASPQGGIIKRNHLFIFQILCLLIQNLVRPHELEERLMTKLEN